MEQFDALSLPQRVVLLGVADLETDGETPARANEIIRVSQSLADHVDDVGSLGEAAVDSALNRLEADGLVAVPEMDDETPIGKGRPAYELSVDADTVYGVADDDDRLVAVSDA